MTITYPLFYALCLITLAFVNLLLGIEYAAAAFIPITLIIWWVNKASWQWLMIVFGLPVIFYLQRYDILSLQMSIAIGCGFAGACFPLLFKSRKREQNEQRYKNF